MPCLCCTLSSLGISSSVGTLITFLVIYLHVVIIFTSLHPNIVDPVLVHTQYFTVTFIFSIIPTHMIQIYQTYASHLHKSLPSPESGVLFSPFIHCHCRRHYWNYQLCHLVFSIFTHKRWPSHSFFIIIHSSLFHLSLSQSLFQTITWSHKNEHMMLRRCSICGVCMDISCLWQLLHLFFQVHSGVWHTLCQIDLYYQSQI